MKPPTGKQLEVLERFLTGTLRVRGDDGKPAPGWCEGDIRLCDKMENRLWWLHGVRPPGPLYKAKLFMLSDRGRALLYGCGGPKP